MSGHATPCATIITHLQPPFFIYLFISLALTNPWYSLTDFKFYNFFFIVGALDYKFTLTINNYTLCPCINISFVFSFSFWQKNILDKRRKYTLYLFWTPSYVL